MKTSRKNVKMRIQKRDKERGKRIIQLIFSIYVVRNKQDNQKHREIERKNYSKIYIYLRFKRIRLAVTKRSRKEIKFGERLDRFEERSFKEIWFVEGR